MLLMDEIDQEVTEREAFIVNTVKSIKDLHKTFNSQMIVKAIL